MYLLIWHVGKVDALTSKTGQLNHEDNLIVAILKIMLNGLQYCCNH